MSRTARTIFVYVAVLLLVVMAIQVFVGDPNAPKELTVDEFQTLLAEGDIDRVLVKEQSNQLEGEFVPGAVPDSGEETFVVGYPGEFEDELTQQILDAGIALESDSERPSAIVSFFFSIFPYILLFGIFIFIFMQLQGGGNRVMQFGKAKAKQVTKDQPKVTFKDVAGAEEAVEELHEIKEFLASPGKFRALGAKIPKGVLLFGPPGTGKTLLARAVAGEAGVPFFSISGSDFVEMFVGVGASRVRDLFEQAKANAPAIIFIDEIDAVGRHRGAGLGGGHDEREQTLNQLLVELDGFDVKTGVIVIAATNRPDILDPALLRPGRFDRQIVVDRPDLKGREAILGVHSKGKPLGEGIKLDVLARQTPGFTGADLANLINEAALLAARRDLDEISMGELEEAIERVIAGPERKSKVMTEDDKRVTAFHEGGHALVGFALPNADPIHKVTIIPRGRAGGYTMALPVEDKMYMRRSELVDQLAMLLGGRTAEEMIFVDPTTGASNDIDKATNLARRMVMEWGMSDRLGPLRYGSPEGEVFLGRDYSRSNDMSDDVASAVDEEIRKLITQAHEEARQILTAHRDALERLADVLMDQETVDAAELKDIFYDVPKWEHTETGALRIRAPQAAPVREGLRASSSQRSDDPAPASP
ncbi:MAG: ATP-dependent zinc metalloprotease FtsH [Acidimicrobiia bacterium]|nr:ATP-dependent zinc metalloprotease FtsH [Acidimicrobiia bacterium]